MVPFSNGLFQYIHSTGTGHLKTKLFQNGRSKLGCFKHKEDIYIKTNQTNHGADFEWSGLELNDYGPSKFQMRSEFETPLNCIKGVGSLV